MPTLYTLREYINATLDKNYNASARPMLEQIAQLAKGQGSAVQAVLRELEDEAERLQDEGVRMKPDNPVLLKTLSVIEGEMVATQNLISANADEIEQSGQEIAPVTVAAKLFMAVTIALLSQGTNPITAEAQYRKAITATGGNFAWPDSLDFATDYTRSAAWIARMEGWGKGYSDIIGNALRQGLSEGWSPIRTAREARRLAENLPVSAAENITRTLQLTSYREAGLRMEVLNGRYIEKKIRISALDERTCLSCISLHGTEIPLGSKPDDHYRGRCDSILIPVGGSMPQTMQADSKPGERNFVPFQTGEEWFASLSPERQAQQASFLKSPAKLKAYKDGTPLSAFIGDHQDSVFGHQIIEKSLLNTVDDPYKYYLGGGGGGSGEIVLPDDLSGWESKLAGRYDYETGALFDANGNKLFEIKGEAEEVSFPREQLKNSQGKIMTHTHPGNETFSVPDIESMVNWNIKEMRAVTPKGVYVMKNNLDWGNGDLNDISNTLKKKRAFNEALKKRVGFEDGKNPYWVIGESGEYWSWSERLWKEIADEMGFGFEFKEW